MFPPPLWLLPLPPLLLPPLRRRPSSTWSWLASTPLKKIKVIKSVREITGLGLAEAKKAVEETPTTLKKPCPRTMQRT